MVKEWHRGQTLRMIANLHYWRGAPKLREVDYTTIPDENTLLTSLRTHEIDFWYYATASQYPAASKIAAWQRPPSGDTTPAGAAATGGD